VTYDNDDLLSDVRPVAPITSRDDRKSVALELVPVELKAANAFILKHHRHHGRIPWHRFSIGAKRVDTGELVGVCVVGRPLSSTVDDQTTVEVTRLCSDGTPNVCSFLYGHAARAAFARGFKRIQTYIMRTESGASLRVSGWLFDRMSHHSRWDHRPKSKPLPPHLQDRKQLWYRGETEASLKARKTQETTERWVAEVKLLSESAIHKLELGRAHAARRGGYAPPPLEKDCPPRPTDGRCERCGQFNTYRGRPAPLVLNHDHTTGAFVDWVCRGCNTCPHGVPCGVKKRQPGTSFGVEKRQPWERLGMSRSSWYAHGKPRRPIERRTQKVIAHESGVSVRTVQRRTAEQRKAA
jgi:hypothetical protein